MVFISKACSALWELFFSVIIFLSGDNIHHNFKEKKLIPNEEQMSNRSPAWKTTTEKMAQTFWFLLWYVAHEVFLLCIDVCDLKHPVCKESTTKWNFSFGKLIRDIFNKRELSLVPSQEVNKTYPDPWDVVSHSKMCILISEVGIELGVEGRFFSGATKGSWCF